MSRISKAGMVFSAALAFFVVGVFFFSIQGSPETLVFPTLGAEEQVTEVSAQDVTDYFVEKVEAFEQSVKEAEAILAKGAAKDSPEFALAVSRAQFCETAARTSLIFTSDVLYLDIGKGILRPNVSQAMTDTFMKTWDRFEAADSWMISQGI